MKTLPILLAAAVLGIALGRGVPTAQAAQAERPVRWRCYVEYHGGVYLDGPCTIAFMGRVGAPVGNTWSVGGRVANEDGWFDHIVALSEGTRGDSNVVVATINPKLFGGRPAAIGDVSRDGAWGQRHRQGLRLER